MKPIKFRAWHHGGGDPRIKGYMNYSYPFPVLFWKGVEDEVLSVELMQFTGLVDYAKNEIYEGDIIQHPNQDQVGLVYWNNYFCGFKVKYTECDDLSNLSLQVGQKGQAVVIGNIYENTELLEDK